MIDRRTFLTSASATVLAAPAIAQSGQAFQIPADMRSQIVAIKDSYPAGEIHLFRNTNNLYYTLGNGRGVAYKVGLGQDGMRWSGTLTVGRKVEWPRWTPTASMIERQPDLYGPYADGMPGGPDNPLGARALYLYRGGQDTLFRIHGTPQPWTVGQNTSNGCVRMYNSEVIDLYNRVPMGTKVIAH